MKNSNILIYQTEDGITQIETYLENETVWLTQAQMATLFAKGRTTITEHIRNIFKEGELREELVCRNFRHTTKHGAIQEKTQTKNELFNAEKHFIKQIETTAKKLNPKKKK